MVRAFVYVLDFLFVAVDDPADNTSHGVILASVLLEPHAEVGSLHRVAVEALVEREFHNCVAVVDDGSLKLANFAELGTSMVFFLFGDLCLDQLFEVGAVDKFLAVLEYTAGLDVARCKFEEMHVRFVGNTRLGLDGAVTIQGKLCLIC